MSSVRIRPWSPAEGPSVGTIRTKNKRCHDGFHWDLGGLYKTTYFMQRCQVEMGTYPLSREGLCLFVEKNNISMRFKSSAFEFMAGTTWKTFLVFGGAPIAPTRNFHTFVFE
ncbi:hypothetical protein TNIN_80211 [Trichonephila inaurata madagascariensis]|uniref:Uncharacterized protein n=1 Tax=Trichonephila inaurata madagascariensis TaxID=2747483 RepID=A0A8X7BTZ0_9ARAC|nr:hypothetical protein TNIN_80211 [Trichonephila inaurata madagascariensis]